MNYYFIDTLGDSHNLDLCVLDEIPEGIGVAYSNIVYGRSIANQFPENATVKMSDDCAGIKLESIVGNTNSFLMVSKNLKELIEQNANIKIECLPFKIIDHKNRLIDSEYFIINPIGVIDCVDHNRSDIDYFKGKVLGINKLVLDLSKLKDDPILFRLKEEPTEYVISEKLKKLIEEKGFTNVKLTEIECVE